jgi:hypothetical protein
MDINVKARKGTRARVPAHLLKVPDVESAITKDKTLYHDYDIC